MRKIVCPVLVAALASAALGQNYTIQTFAGGGVPQNIQAVAASLGAVTGIATDTIGNVYIALPTYSAVVKMDVTGTLTLVAGNGKPGFSGDNGPAPSAQLNLNVAPAISSATASICQCPTPIPGGGLAVDSAGNLYIADSGNNRVRKVSSGIITTVAGNTVSLSSPTGVAVDSSGNLYIADTGNQVVRKVSGNVTVTVAGTGTAGALGNGGPATAAQLSFPIGVAVSSVGNLYITDFGNDALRLVSGGVMTAPVVLTGLEPTAVAVDSSGNAFLTAGGFGVAEQPTNANTILTAGNQNLVNGYSGDNGPALSAQMNFPSGVAIDASGNLYIADDGNNVVRKVAGGIITTVAGSPQGFIGDSGSALSAQLATPTCTATGPAGETYIVDQVHNVVRKVANGVITTVAGTGVPNYSGDGGLATSATLNAPWGVVVDAAGNLYISDSGKAGVITTLAGIGTPNYSGFQFGLAAQFPETAGTTGTIEFQTPTGGQISVLGIRTTRLGSSNTITTIPVLANVGTSGGSIAHIAVANGWKTTFVLVNASSTRSQAHLKFFTDDLSFQPSSPLPLSVSYPQLGGAPTTMSEVDPSLGPGAMLMIESTGLLADPLIEGSAQLATDGNVSGFVIFRYEPTGQEAVVPLESRNASAYVLAFDNTGGIATGVAVNSVSSTAVDVHVVLRNETGAQIGTGTETVHVDANGHIAFGLSGKFPVTANIRGTVEFDTPTGAQIGVLGIRTPPTSTYTTLPLLAK